jgi:D-3-phosphoglycerate dehydrogenase
MSAVAQGAVLFIGAGLSTDAVAMADEAGIELITIPPYPTESSLIETVRAHRPKVIIVRSGHVTAAVIDAAAPDLRLIAKHGVGVDSIDVNAASQRGIPVSFTAGANSQSVAEHALALMLATARRVNTLDARIRAGHWDKSTATGIELKGKTLGLFGFGSIARLLADLVAPLQMPIAVYDPYAPRDLAIANGRRVESPDELFAGSDVISLHCPLNDETRGMINANTIGLMRPHAILVNTARGGLIDEPSLALALRNGRIAGAGLDTLADEPPRADNPLLQAPNLVVTPHVGASTSEAKDRVGTIVMKQAIDALQGILPEPWQLAVPAKIAA